MNKLTIKSVGATTMRGNLSDVLDAVEHENHVMLIKRHNKADAALVNIDLLEDLLAAQSKEYLANIVQARKDIENGDIIAASDVFGEL